MPRGKPLPIAPEKFWPRLNKTDTCWLWTGPLRKDGYGEVKIGGQQRPTAHRVAWTLTHGFPGKLCVLHRCDVRHCARPDHLFLGTYADNSADMVAKGRQSRGEGQHLSMLTEAKVREMRRLYATGKYGYRPLGPMFGVHWQTVRFVVRRMTWKHVH